MSTTQTSRSFTLVDVDGDRLHVFHSPAGNLMEFTAHTGDAQVSVYVTEEHMRELLEWYRSRL